MSSTEEVHSDIDDIVTRKRFSGKVGRTAALQTPRTAVTTHCSKTTKTTDRQMERVPHIDIHRVGHVMTQGVYSQKGLVKDKLNLINLISKLNFYKLIPYPMVNCFTGRRDRSRQTLEKDILYILYSQIIFLSIFE